MGVYENGDSRSPLEYGPQERTPNFANPHMYWNPNKDAILRSLGQSTVASLIYFVHKTPLPT